MSCWREESSCYRVAGASVTVLFVWVILSPMLQVLAGWPDRSNANLPHEHNIVVLQPEVSGFSCQPHSKSTWILSKSIWLRAWGANFQSKILSGLLRFWLFCLLWQGCDIRGQPSVRAELPPSLVWRKCVSHWAVTPLTLSTILWHTCTDIAAQTCQIHFGCFFGQASLTCPCEITGLEMRGHVWSGPLSQQPDLLTRTSAHLT